MLSYDAKESMCTSYKSIDPTWEKISMEKDCVNTFANTFSNETANAFTSTSGRSQRYLLRSKISNITLIYKLFLIS